RHTEHDIIPNGTIAQLGERAIEVRKVAGSIPARPIIFCIFPTPATVLGERAIEVRKVAGSIPARPITFSQLGERAIEVRKVAGPWDIMKWGDSSIGRASTGA
ncbi:hypothetical protein N7536_002541, partial [Penicillium majusculum]